MGTTLATSCGLEGNGEPCAFITRKGFKNILVISNQSKPDTFDLNIKRPEPLYGMTPEICEGVTFEDFSEDLTHRKKELVSKENIIKENNGETFRVWKTPDVQSAEITLGLRNEGCIKSMAVEFLHAYRYPAHERSRKIPQHPVRLEKLGRTQI